MKKKMAAASLLVLPMLMMPNKAEAQGAAAPPSAGGTKPPPKSGPGSLALTFAKVEIEYTVIGVSGKNPVFKDASGRFFFVKSNGDLEFLEQKIDSKHKDASRYPGLEYLKIKFSDASVSGKVNILGLNASGDLYMKNSRGETFKLSENGSPVPVSR